MFLPNNAFAFVYKLVLAMTTPHTPNIVANRETVFKRNPSHLVSIPITIRLMAMCLLGANNMAFGNLVELLIIS
jgi:hypothetical protein